MPRLVALLQDNSPAVRQNGMRALAAVGHAAGQERGRVERSRSEVLFQQAGTETTLILAVDVMAVNFSLPPLSRVKKRLYTLHT